MPQCFPVLLPVNFRGIKHKILIGSIFFHLISPFFANIILYSKQVQHFKHVARRLSSHLINFTSTGDILRDEVVLELY